MIRLAWIEDGEHTPNVETAAFADLHLESLRMARNAGTAQNLNGRRRDLYTTIWRER